MSDPGEPDAELLDAFGGVRIDHDNAAYHRGLLERRLLINRCDECGVWHHPPRSVCPRCWSRSVTPTDVAGDGVIALVTILRQGPPQPATGARDQRDMIVETPVHLAHKRSCVERKAGRSPPSTD